MYKVHNTVRSVHHRLKRYQAPQHARLKQHIGAGKHRILRGRPLVLSEAAVLEHLEELKEKVAKGLVEVRTFDGRKVNLEDMSEPEVIAPAPPPKKVLDSAANDKNLNIGERLPQFPGGLPVGSVPPHVAGAGVPGPLEHEKDEVEVEVENDPFGEEEEADEVQLEDPVGKKDE